MELQPCPFCGFEAKAFHHTVKGMPDSWHIECENETCGCGTCHHETRKQAAHVWNVRVGDAARATAAEAREAKLREALRALIEQCWSVEEELTEGYYGTHYSGESLPLCNARAALEADNG
jgi:hypothetical protein